MHGARGPAHGVQVAADQPLGVADPALSLRVLRASNSAAAGGSSRISSVRQAVVMVGLQHIRQWAMLMVIDDVAEATEDQMVAALTRARLCENVAAKVGAPADTAFMAGLISGVADLLGLPHAAMADQLPLSADIVAALVHGTGPLGDVLHVVNAYERGELATADVAADYMDAIRWSARAVQATSRLATA